MSAAAFVRGARRSIKPVSGMIVGQLQLASVSSSGVRRLSTIVTGTSSNATGWMKGSIAERSFMCAASSTTWDGVGVKRSSLVISPHSKFASSSSSAAVEKQDKEDEQKDADAKQVAHEEWLSENNLVKSDYWGVTTKTYVRKDGTKWPWHCFQVSSFLQLM
jgi:hypothetical protein